MSPGCALAVENGFSLAIQALDLNGRILVLPDNPEPLLKDFLGPLPAHRDVVKALLERIRLRLSCVPTPNPDIAMGHYNEDLLLCRHRTTPYQT